MDEQSESTSQTSSSMLEGMRNGNPEAWAEFVAKYTRLVHRHCRKRQLQAADTDDLTQELIAHLFQRFSKFHYDRTQSFRGYLYTTTKNAITDFRRKRWPTPLPMGEDTSSGLPAPLAGEDFINELVEAMLYADAEARVLAAALPWQREAFRLSQQGEADEALARRLEQKLGTVRVAISRITRRIQDEMKKGKAT